MDYEFRITLAEKELAHLREMQALMRARQNTADDRLDRLQEITASGHRFVHIEDTLAEVADLQKQQAEAILALTSKMDALVESMLHRGNGHAPGPAA